MSTLGRLAERYAKLLFGRSTFCEKAGTNRGAMLFRMIGANLSFCFMIARRESTHRFSCAFALPDPDPVRALQEDVVRHLRRTGREAAISASDVSSNMTASARPWLKARTAFVTLSVTTTSAVGKQRLIQRS